MVTRVGGNFHLTHVHVLVRSAWVLSVTSAVTQAGGTSQDLQEARNMLRVLFPSAGDKQKSHPAAEETLHFL